ncbi:MAG TPA: hypothetical protein VG797_09905 [Phycisphaerales bacterium]|nr:hypothetical protein [Phycisphaerales bacterium]
MSKPTHLRRRGLRGVLSLICRPKPSPPAVVEKPKQPSERAIDEALAATFPGSDPVSLHLEEPRDRATKMTNAPSARAK